MLKQLNLTKNAERLSLNLRKEEIFRVELYWDSQHDLDAHALLAGQEGGQEVATVTSFDRVLSTYNVKTRFNKEPALTKNPDGSFGTPCGSLHHSGDALTGGSDVNEIITINGDKVPEDVTEIPIFVTIHDKIDPENPRHKFVDVRMAGIRIKNDAGVVLQEYQLSNQFGDFKAVQMGSLMVNSHGWEFKPVGVGFNGSFNDILGHF